MKLRDYRRAQLLLQVAPWADPAAVREKLTDIVRSSITDSLLNDSPSRHLQYTEFCTQERHVLPRVGRFQDSLYKILADLYPDERDADPQFDQAYYEFDRYFFSTNDQMHYDGY